jgi:hypothetical protein
MCDIIIIIIIIITQNVQRENKQWTVYKVIHSLCFILWALFISVIYKLLLPQAREQSPINSQ